MAPKIDDPTPINLPTAYHIDLAITSSEDKLILIRFGVPDHPLCIRQNDILHHVAPVVCDCIDIYLCDISKIPDFNDMYELYDPISLMFFFRNKRMMCDYGTGDNNKIIWVVEKEEFVELASVVYGAAKKGKGVVGSPIDYSTRYRLSTKVFR